MISRNILLASLLLLIATPKAQAHTEFTPWSSFYNVHIGYNDMIGKEYHVATNMLCLALNKLTKAVHKESIHITIHHCPKYYEYDHLIAITGKHLPSLSINYDTANKHGFCDDKEHPTLTIYYQGDFSIEKYLQIVYFSLNHLEEIQRNQRNLWLPFKRRGACDVAISSSSLNIDNDNPEIVRSILNQKMYNYWFHADRKVEIGYYFKNDSFHVIEPLTQYPAVTLANPFPETRYKYLFPLPGIIDIVRFRNDDYLIFCSDTTIYHLSLKPLAYSGPYKIPKLSFAIYDYWGLFHSQNQVDDALVLTMRYSYADDALYNIIFDKRRQILTTDYFAVKFRDIQADLYGIHSSHKRRNHLPVYCYPN